MDFLVRTRCFTFNHGKFISKALEGFSMQQTTFPVVTVIVDDASTDNTAEVIRDFVQEHFVLDECGYDKATEYGHVTFARHKRNRNCYFAVIYLAENHFKKKDKKPYYAEWSDIKYEAMCEGDDYWTDPLKLQRQVDFLESHPDYMMCFHKVKVLAEEERERHFFEHLEEREYSAREIYDRWTVPTCSVVYRDFGLESNRKIYYGDIYKWLQIAEKGKVFCLGFCGGVYRRHSGSLSSQTSSSELILLADQYRYLGKRFPALKDISRRKEDENLKYVVRMPYFRGILKYRFRYMQLHPDLFFSSFLTKTLLHYTPLRHK